MSKDKVLVSVPVKKKRYYYSDIIESLLRKGDMAIKKEDGSFLLTTIDEKIWRMFMDDNVKPRKKRS